MVSGGLLAFLIDLISTSQNNSQKVVILVGYDDELTPLTCGFNSRTANKVPSLPSTLFGVITVHNKDEWNWGLEIREVHFCDECSIEFPEKAKLRKHLESGHKEVSNIIVEDTIHKIEPDHVFLTQNTKDLEDLLKTLP